MRRIINNLRKQPERVRRHILHVVTLIAGGVLGMLWVYSLGTSLSDPDTQAKIENELEPFSALKASLVDGYQSISQ